MSFLQWVFWFAGLGALIGGYACWRMMGTAEGWRAWAWGVGLAGSVVGFFLSAMMVSAFDPAGLREHKRRRRDIVRSQDD